MQTAFLFHSKRSMANHLWFHNFFFKSLLHSKKRPTPNSHGLPVPLWSLFCAQKNFFPKSSQNPWMNVSPRRTQQELWEGQTPYTAELLRTSTLGWARSGQETNAKDRTQGMPASSALGWSLPIFALFCWMPSFIYPEPKISTGTEIC